MTAEWGGFMMKLAGNLKSPIVEPERVRERWKKGVKVEMRGRRRRRRRR